MRKILLIDDDDNLRDLIKESLEQVGYEVLGLRGGTGLLSSFNTFGPDIIILDVHMPDVSGVDLVKNIRSFSETQWIPVIMISGDSEIQTKIQSLDFGADDYLVKPFSNDELVARIKAVLRRSKNDNIDDVVRVDELEVNRNSRLVTYEGKEVSLTLTEFRILNELLMKRGNVLSRDELRQSALNNLNVTDRTIDVHMTSLRKKIDLCSKYIKTVRGVGYLFVR